jgi:hypothetical protein
MSGGVVNASAVAVLYKIMNKTTEVGAGDGMIHQSKTNENAIMDKRCLLLHTYSTLHSLLHLILIPTYVDCRSS